MTPEKQRIKIAKICGWHDFFPEAFNQKWWGGKPTARPPKTNDGPRVLPDYLNDLDAMHEAEKILGFRRWHDYSMFLIDTVGASHSDLSHEGTFARIHATAAQRAEAFLRTLGLWEE